MTGHPSFLALDRARLGVKSDTVDDHVSGCTICRAYLEAVPDDLPPRPGVPTARPRRLSAWWPAGLSLAAVAVAAVLFVPRGVDRGYVASKGEPAITTYLKRGDEVFQWSGAAVRPKDRITLGVRAAGFDHISVASPSVDGLVVLHTEPLRGKGEQRLQASFEVGQSHEPDVLVVVLTHGPPTDDLFDDKRLKSSTDVWAKTLNFEREKK